jgi:hypothetical protein
MSKIDKSLIKETDYITDWDNFTDHPTITTLSGSIDNHLTEVKTISGYFTDISVGDCCVLNNNETIQAVGVLPDSYGSFNSWWDRTDNRIHEVFIPHPTRDKTWIVLANHGSTTRATLKASYFIIEENEDTWNYTTSTNLPVLGGSYATGGVQGGYDPDLDCYFAYVGSQWPDDRGVYNVTYTFTVEFTGAGIDTALWTWSDPLTAGQPTIGAPNVGRPALWDETNSCFLYQYNDTIATGILSGTGAPSATIFIEKNTITTDNVTVMDYDSNHDQYIATDELDHMTISISGDSIPYVTDSVALGFDPWVALTNEYKFVRFIPKYNTWCGLSFENSTQDAEFQIGRVTDGGITLEHTEAISLPDKLIPIDCFYNPVIDKLFIVARQEGGVSFHPLYTKTVDVDWSDLTNLYFTNTLIYNTYASQIFVAFWDDSRNKIKLFTDDDQVYIEQGNTVLRSNNFAGIYQGLTLSAEERTPEIWVKSDTTDGSTTFIDSGTEGLTLQGDGAVDHSTDQVDVGFGSSAIHVADQSSAIHVQSTGTTSLLSNYSGDWTYEMKIYPTHASATNDTYGGFNGWIYFRYTSGVYRVTVFTNEGGQQQLLPSTNPTLNAWNHIAVERVDDTVYYYVNGVIQPSTLDVGTNTLQTAASTFYIGGVATYGFVGRIGYYDDVKLSMISKYKGQSFVPPTQYSNYFMENRIGRHGYMDANQSGLTINTNYYIDEWGALTTTSTDILVGKAVSDTELIIKG